MITVTVVSKDYDQNSNRIVGYMLQYPDGQYKYMYKADLKKAMLENRIRVTNLKITADGKMRTIERNKCLSEEVPNKNESNTSNKTIELTLDIVIVDKILDFLYKYRYNDGEVGINVIPTSKTKDVVLKLQMVGVQFDIVDQLAPRIEIGVSRGNSTAFIFMNADKVYLGETQLMNGIPQGLFQDCTFKFVDVHRLDASKVTDMSNMYKDCKYLEFVNMNGMDTSNVVFMQHMFEGCYALKKLDLRTLNTSKVENMNKMFYQCIYLKEICISRFDTNNVKSMVSMFAGDRRLESLDVRHFNTENVENMTGMFKDCENLTELDLSSFRTPKLVMMSDLFHACKGLQKVNVENFDTHNVVEMNCVFYKCLALKFIDLSNWDVTNCKEFSYMFAECKHMRALDLDNFNPERMTRAARMFSGCDGLKELHLRNFKITDSVRADWMFDKCVDLEYLDVYSINYDDSLNSYRMLNLVLTKCKKLRKVVTKDKYLISWLKDDIPDIVICNK